MGLFSSAKARRMQLFHHDNGDLEFRRRDLVGQSAVEFNDQKEPVDAWEDKFQTIYPFNGFKNIPADGVQLACSRYPYFQIHPVLKGDAAPPKDGNIANPYYTKIADSHGMTLIKAKKPRAIWEKLTIIFGGFLFLEGILWGILIYVSRR